MTTEDAVNALKTLLVRLEESGGRLPDVTITDTGAIRTLLAERDQLAKEKEYWRLETKRLTDRILEEDGSDADKVALLAQEISAERDRLAVEVERFAKERDNLRMALNRYSIPEGTVKLIEERDRLTAENERLRAYIDALTAPADAATRPAALARKDG